MDWSDARDRIIEEALARGWAAAGVAGVEPFHAARLRALAAIDEGRLAGMAWYTRERVEASADLAKRHPWAQSILALAWPYRPAPRTAGARAPDARPRGRFAAYVTLANEDGLPADYHDVLRRACAQLESWLRTQFADISTKCSIDHGWAFDKAIAERAGIGFIGKNTTLITEGAGSYVLLAAILMSLPLPPTAPSHRGCGSCSACMPACPTGALVAPGVMDAGRCISYLTIEHRGSIPLELRALVGTWAFGCDLCMEACPINHRLAPEPLVATVATTRSGPVPYPDLIECLELDDDEFVARFRGTAVWRAGRAGLARNAAIALGNSGDPRAVPPLERSRDSDPDPVVRESAAWALDRLVQSG